MEATRDSCTRLEVNQYSVTQTRMSRLGLSVALYMPVVVCQSGSWSDIYFLFNIIIIRISMLLPYLIAKHIDATNA